MPIMAPSAQQHTGSGTLKSVMNDARKPPRGKRKKSSQPEEKLLHPELVPDVEIDPQRREKIEKIKQALADGTYRISNEDVARKLIDHMRRPQSDPSGESKS